MKSILKLSLMSLVSLMVLGRSALAETQCKSILDIASSTPGLSTLVTAIKAAGLVETLSGQGPFTVFAPVNQAFDKIPPASLQSLLADRLMLRSVLLAHVVVGQELTLKNLNNRVFGENFVLMANGSVKRPGETQAGNDGFDGANYVLNDIQACNGVVQVIDTVLNP